MKYGPRRRSLRSNTGGIATLNRCPCWRPQTYLRQAAVALFAVEWVGDLQTREPGKVPIGCVEHGSMLNGQCRQVGVHYQRPAHLSFYQQAHEYLPVALTWRQDSNHWPLDPSTDRCGS